MVVTLGLNLSGRDLNIFLATFEFWIGSLWLKDKLTILLSLEYKEEKFWFSYFLIFLNLLVNICNLETSTTVLP